MAELMPSSRTSGGGLWLRRSIWEEREDLFDEDAQSSDDNRDRSSGGGSPLDDKVPRRSGDVRQGVPRMGRRQTWDHDGAPRSTAHAPPRRSCQGGGSMQMPREPGCPRIEEVRLGTRNPMWRTSGSGPRPVPCQRAACISHRSERLPTVDLVTVSPAGWPVGAKDIFQ